MRRMDISLASMLPATRNTPSSVNRTPESVFSIMSSKNDVLMVKTVQTKSRDIGKSKFDDHVFRRDKVALVVHLFRHLSGMNLQ